MGYVLSVWLLATLGCEPPAPSSAFMAGGHENYRQLTVTFNTEIQGCLEAHDTGSWQICSKSGTNVTPIEVLTGCDNNVYIQVEMDEKGECEADISTVSYYGDNLYGLQCEGFVVVSPFTIQFETQE